MKNLIDKIHDYIESTPAGSLPYLNGIQVLLDWLDYPDTFKLQLISVHAGFKYGYYGPQYKQIKYKKMAKHFVAYVSAYELGKPLSKKYVAWIDAELTKCLNSPRGYWVEQQHKYG